MTHPKPKADQASDLLVILENSVRLHGLRTTKAALLNAASDPSGREDSMAVADQANKLRMACSSAGISHEVLIWGSRALSNIRGRNGLALLSDALQH